MIDKNITEFIGYMKASNGENDFSMFINENKDGNSAGFRWDFLDFAPVDLHNYEKIYIHLVSYEEIVRPLRLENNMLKLENDILREQAQELLKRLDEK